MSEVRLPAPVPAIELSRETFRARDEPGSFYLEDEGEGAFLFWYRCPCGCGAKGALFVGKNLKPNGQPSWEWNGSRSAPTLRPSVNHVGHWHGWLTDGAWHQ